MTAEAGGGLGQAVALVDRDADAAEEVAEPGPQRRAAGDGRLAPAAERGPQLPVDQPVEDRVLHLQPEARAAVAVERLAVLDRDRRRPGRRSCPCRRRAPAAWRCCRPSRRPAGTARTNVGWKLARSGEQVLDVGGVAERRVPLAIAPIWITRAKTCASGRNSSVEAFSRNRSPSSGVTPSMSVTKLRCGQHAALGPAGRAGGVDDRGEVVRRRPRRGARGPRRRRCRRRPRPARRSRRRRCCQTCRRPARRRGPTRPSRRAPAVSTKNATAPESDRIHSTCSALDVS